MVMVRIMLPHIILCLILTPFLMSKENLGNQQPQDQEIDISSALRNYVYSLANTLSKGRVLRVDSYSDELYGLVIKVVTDLTAKEALELWLKLIDTLRNEGYKVAVAVEWTGEDNVSQDQLVEYIVRIMVNSGLGPKALPGFDAVSAVREGRGE